MNLEQFIRERAEPKNGRNKTLNIDEDLHLFFKITANHYNIAISDLMYHILTDWKKKYQQDIKDDMLRNFSK